MLGLYVSQVTQCQTRLCWTRSRPLLTNLGRYPPFPLYHLSLRIPSRTLASRPPSNDLKSSTPSTRPAKSTILSKVLPVTFAHPPPTASSFRKILSLARPERKPLLIAIGLLLVSSSVSMSVPFTIGKLIDYFSSTTPVRVIFHIHCAKHSVDIYSSQQIPY